MRSLIAPAALVLLAACGAAPSGARDAVFAPVPADSPLLVVMESAPEGHFDRRFGPLADELDKMLTQLGELEVPDGEADEMARLLRALADQLRGRFNEQGMAEIGLRQGAYTVLYAEGGLPVLRMELASGARFVEFVQAVAKDAGHAIELKTWEGHTWWAFDVPETPISVAFVVSGEVFASAVLLGETAEAALPRLTGQSPPRTPLVGSTRLEALREAYGFTWYLGSLELDRLAADILERVHSVVPVTAACRDEHGRWIEALPKMYFGLVDSGDPDTDASRLVIPLSKAARADARAMLGPPPGLDADPDRAFILAGGLGIRIGPLLDWLRRKAAPIRIQPYQCESLRWLNAFASEVEEKLRPVAQTPVPGLSGLSVGFTALALGEIETMRLAGAVVLGTPDAGQLLGLAALTAPGMFELGAVSEDGAPYAVELPPEIGRMVGPVHVSRSAWALGLSAGEGNAARVADMVRTKPEDDGVFARLAFDSGKVADIQRSFARFAEGAPESLTDKAVGRIQSAMASVYDYYSAEYRLTDIGIDGRVVQTLDKP